MSATTSKEFLAAKGYDYNEVKVDVYAVNGDEGWELSRVTAAGDAQDLIPMFTSSQIDDFDALVERRYLAYAQDENDNARVERAVSNRAAVVDLMYRAVFPGAPM